MVDEHRLEAYIHTDGQGMVILPAAQCRRDVSALRALNEVHTVGGLRRVDEKHGLGQWDGWYDLQSVDPSDEDIDYYGSNEDDAEQLASYRDHPAFENFELEMPPKPVTWLPGELWDALEDWFADDYRIAPQHVRQARVLLEARNVLLNEEPLVADLVDGDY